MSTNLSYRADSPMESGRRRVQLLASLADSDFVLRQVCDQLDLTPAKLSRLLGRSATNSYQWFNMGRSPSQAYWVRIAYLQYLSARGINLRRVRTLDWSAPPYKIEWWPGAEPTAEELEKMNDTTRRSEGNVPVRDAWGDIPAGQSAD